MLVGVYGTLKKGKGNHQNYLGKTEFLRNAEVKGFRLFENGIPFAVEDDTSPYNICIEVYNVTDKATLIELDRLEGHPDFYERKVFDVEGDAVWIYTCNHIVEAKHTLRELTDGIF